MLSALEWAKWQDRHPDVRFMGMAVGDAIKAVLDDNAFNQAYAFARNPDPEARYDPGLFLDQIVATLEGGGFEFRTLTPRREINAALMKLEGVEKKGAAYRVADADETLERCRAMFQDEARGSVPF
jgi:hypothetical protein